MEPAQRFLLEAHYGDGVSAILRSGDFPDEARSYFVQRQDAHAAQVSRWFTQAVYTSAEAAEAAAARWGGGSITFATYDLEAGTSTPDLSQPVSMHRVVTLLELFAEGPKAVASVVYDLATSDHEWLISSELGSEGKIALISASETDSG